MTLKEKVILLILLSAVYTYPLSLDIDASTVERVILSHKGNRFIISAKNDILIFLNSFSKINDPTCCCGILDPLVIDFKTTGEDASYSIDLEKSRHSFDSLMNYYVDRIHNEPNCFQFFIQSDKFDLFDTAMNYLKANFYVENEVRTDKIRLTSHRIKLESRDYIDSSIYKDVFTKLVKNINKKSQCAFIGPMGIRSYRLYHTWSYIINVNIYFPCRKIYDFTEVMRYLDSLKWLVIEEVEFKKEFKIMFWVEINPQHNKYEIISEITKEMNKKGITCMVFYADPNE